MAGEDKKLDKVRLGMDVLAFVWPVVGFFATFQVTSYRVGALETKVQAIEQNKDSVAEKLQLISEKQVRVETKLDILLDKQQDKP